MSTFPAVTLLIFKKTWPDGFGPVIVAVAMETSLLLGLLYIAVVPFDPGKAIVKLTFVLRPNVP
ncbi:hypothetical protein [Lysinibacillus sp. 54212]|uniref:hypothetical protein n=1 Tax=Lysinibacillus sp. 54212 TaxID=3119829 RepID=UPI002FCAB6D4